GDFDLLSPFVVAFLQKNAGQRPQDGFAFGNQATWNFFDRKLGLFVNTQVVFAFDWATGLGLPVAGQAFGGLQIDLPTLLLPESPPHDIKSRPPDDTKDETPRGATEGTIHGATEGGVAGTHPDRSPLRVLAGPATAEQFNTVQAA